MALNLRLLFACILVWSLFTGSEKISTSNYWSSVSLRWIFYNWDLLLCNILDYLEKCHSTNWLQITHGLQHLVHWSFSFATRIASASLVWLVVLISLGHSIITNIVSNSMTPRTITPSPSFPEPRPSGIFCLHIV